jgi:hypothetical protein
MQGIVLAPTDDAFDMSGLSIADFNADQVAPFLAYHGKHASTQNIARTQ